MNWMAQLTAWDVSQKQTIARAGMALGFGLDPSQFVQPFPGSPGNVTTINTTTPTTTAPATTARGVGTLAKLGIAAALAVGSAGTGLGVASLFQKPAASINTATGFGLELSPAK